VKPNALLIMKVRSSYTQSGIWNPGEKAQALLDWMLTAYANEEDASYLPNETCSM
jgi:hypothetical protein